MDSSTREWKRRTLSICQFNVLCHHYEHPTLPDDQTHFWKARQYTLKSQLDWINADVVCLQEVNPVSWYRQMFSEKYDVLFASKGHSTRFEVGSCTAMDLAEMRTLVNDDDDGAAMMFKKGVVDVISTHRISLHSNGQKDRQFALVAHVFHHETRKTLFVCACHMKADMERAEDARRIEHAKQIFRALSTIRVTDPTAPLFFTGDLNGDPTCASMQLLTSGSATLDDGSRHFLGQRGMSSAMKNLLGGSEPDFTLLEGGSSKCLDYVLYEDDRAVPVAYLTPPTVEAWGKDAIPMCGSDHIPLVVEFMLL